MIKLINDDCLNILPKIKNNKIDLILADPPYGTTLNKWDSIIDLNVMWKNLNRIVKNDGAIVLTASQPFTTKLIHSNIKYFKYCLIWKKIKQLVI